MKKTLLAVALLALLAACQKEEGPPPPQELPQGRVETQSIRNTDAVGYRGSEIADQVDQTLDANDERVKQTDEAAQE
jgi:nitrous oxide reductase accessory protein NosL